MDLSQEYDLCPSRFLVVRDTFEFVVGFFLVRDKHDRNLLFLKRRREVAIKPVRRFHENLGPGWHGPDIASKNEARDSCELVSVRRIPVGVFSAALKRFRFSCPRPRSTRILAALV